MAGLSWSTQRVLLGRGTRYSATGAAGALSMAQALGMLGRSAHFRDDFTAVLAGSPYAAFRWEMPPLTTSTVGRPFEFVLADDPFLAMPPEPDVFGSYFRELPLSVTVLPVGNLGRTATLVVPRGIADEAVYGHLAAFVRGAPRDQVHALWRCLADAASRALSDRPLWVSTAGGGVSWLHVRVEREPKYYTYRPYAIER